MHILERIDRAFADRRRQSSVLRRIWQDQQLILEGEQKLLRLHAGQYVAVYAGRMTFGSTLEEAANQHGEAADKTVVQFLGSF